MDLLKRTAKIKDYFYYNDDFEGLVLCGESHWHPTIEDGHHVVTSTILRVAGAVHETRNTIYVAETPLIELSEYWHKKLKQLWMSEDRVIFFDQYLGGYLNPQEDTTIGDRCEN